MRSILIALIALLLLFQYEFWFSNGGVFSIWKLKQEILQQQAVNQQLKARNDVLLADIQDLKRGNKAIEERARNDLGMVRKGETFYQVVKP